MWSKLPVIGWLIALLFTISTAIPFYYLWNYVAPKYLSEMPIIYQQLPFWDIVWIFLTISIVKHILIGSSFKSTVNNKNNKKDGK